MADQTDAEVIRRELDTDGETPTVQIVEIVASLEGIDQSELPPMYNCIDGVLKNLFSDPPAPEAQMIIEFSYRTYRITVNQDGTAKFVKTE
ncbi:HalOD1 output domain-containing protein [Halostagnicola kamekurae]|uniref:Halobacterial output domain-containing protein n=1 Tax=Halostagnicola kamekurae TaxID=619731 RepID=A0A1I6RJ55_9EURY|nr:HalOD1 output domain-containing protein [Halostagnicola kamekurae]SFS64705.1 hypothetical protein SAMN04488556_1829 [Halostagnicola kamekurae]